jgi:hypothetical protein
MRNAFWNRPDLMMPTETRTAKWGWSETATQRVKNSIETSLTPPKTIELAGYHIIAMPDELRPISTEKQKELKQQGWLIDPTYEQLKRAEKELWAPNIKSYYNKDWRNLAFTIDRVKLTGYPLFQRITKKLFALHLPEYVNMTEEQSTQAGIYPNIGYASYSAKIAMKEWNNARLPNFTEKKYAWELVEIYEAAKTKAFAKNPKATQEDILAEMGTAFFGLLYTGNSEVCDIGTYANIGSATFHRTSNTYGLNVYHDSPNAGILHFEFDTIISSVGIVKNSNESFL